MYKTFIQLVLLLVLILIIFFIYNKYFHTKDKIDEVENTNSLIIESAEKKEIFKKDLVKKNIDNEIIDLMYEKFDTNGNKYFINAKKGAIDNKNPNIIYMNEVEASLIYLNNEKLIIYSKEAVLNKESFKTTFSKEVKLFYQEQTLESDILEFFIDKNIAIFKDNVRYYGPEYEAFADIVNINLLTKEIDIKSKNQKTIKVKKKN